jgi:hypothetical protein
MPDEVLTIEGRLLKLAEGSVRATGFGRAAGLQDLSEADPGRRSRAPDGLAFRERRG